jgi:hypothetical protein
VPFYRVRLSDGTPDKAMDLTESFTARRGFGTYDNGLFRAAIDGRVTDPAMEPFQTWPSVRRRTLWPSNDWAYLHSYHQLLGLTLCDRAEMKAGD